MKVDVKTRRKKGEQPTFEIYCDGVYLGWTKGLLSLFERLRDIGEANEHLLKGSVSVNIEDTIK